jgi:hypothetical protein
MTMKRFCLVLMAILIFQGPVFGFDGQRKGFILGGGIGIDIGHSKFHRTLTGHDFERDRETKQFGLGGATDFKIGYAPSNQLEIVYRNKASIVPMESVPVFILNSVNVNFYFKEQGPSPLISVGLGLAVNIYPFVRGSITRTGFGFHIGAGHEISKHWAVVFGYIYIAPKDEYESSYVKEVSQFRISALRISMIYTVF